MVSSADMKTVTFVHIWICIKRSSLPATSDRDHGLDQGTSRVPSLGEGRQAEVLCGTA